MSSQQPPQAPATAPEAALTATLAAAPAAVPAAAPAAVPAAASTATPSKATAGNEATMPVDEAHHSKNMMHSNPANRNFNAPSLNSTEVKIQGAALNNDPKPHRNSVVQNNIKNLKFSIEAILSKNDNIKLAH